jgi:hypothetical protein
MGGQRPALAALRPGKESRYSLYRKLDELQGRTARVCGKSLSPTGIRSPDRPARSDSLSWPKAFGCNKSEIIPP